MSANFVRRALASHISTAQQICNECRRKLGQAQQARGVSTIKSASNNALRWRLESGLHTRPARPIEGTVLSQVSKTQARAFSSTRRQSYKSVEEAKSRYRLGPFSWQAGILFLVAGAIVTVYFRHEKDRMQRKRVAEHSKSVGRPLVGGPFKLIDHDGHEFTEQNLKGKYSLVYFGFTNCPDICPEELDKMAGMIDKVKATHGTVMRPVFITCDPARDTPEVTKHYLADFHEDILGLTGTYDAVKSMCKAYRVYFSTPQDVQPGQDYLVDHSIYFYLMDPEGDFVEAIGRNFTVDAAAKVINDHISDWKGKIDRS